MLLGMIMMIRYRHNCPANTRHPPKVGPMLVYRLRRWPRIIQHWVDVSCLLGDIYDKGCIHTRVKLRILQNKKLVAAYIISLYPANIRCWPNGGLMLVQRSWCSLWYRWYNQPLYRYTPYHWHTLYHIISADSISFSVFSV